jgi:ubiquinone/menaquinone biosynthesis C-methylase UbiE
VENDREVLMYCRYFKLVILFLVFILIPCQVEAENKEHDSSLKKGPSYATPIDCPLRKKGVLHDHNEPFKHTDKYIDFLEREDRITWQKPDVVIEKLNIKGDENIADVGAGSGYFSFPLASAVPQGRIYAIDIEPKMIRYIHHKAIMNDIENIEVILAEPDDPKVPEDSDIVFICDVLHHIENKLQWLKKIYSGMKKGARLILIEFKEGDLPEGPPEQIKISQNDIISNSCRAGFTKIYADNTLLPYQNFLVFKKE